MFSQSTIIKLKLSHQLPAKCGEKFG